MLRTKQTFPVIRKTIPVAQNILGEDHALTLMMKQKCAQSLYRDDGATLDDLREAVTTLEDVGRIARRVFGGAHPTTASVECALETSRAMLRALWCPRIAVFEEFCEMGGEDESG